MLPKKSFVTFINEKYAPLADKLTESIVLFSKNPIIVYSYNFDYTPKYPNVYSKRINDENLKLPQFEIFTNTSPDHMGIVDRGDKNTYYTLSRKPIVLLDAINNGVEEGVFLDADGLVRENIDDVFELGKECEDYPLIGKGLFEYMMLYGKGDPAVGPPLEQPMMDLLGIPNRTLYYGQTNVVFFNDRCKEYFEECVSVANNPIILEQNLLYAPYHDETIMNVLLWKRKATKQLPIVHFNLTDFEWLQKFNTSEGGIFVENCPWHKLPENKNDIKFFHGCKSLTELDKCLNFLNKKRSGKNAIIIGSYANTKKKVEVLSRCISQLKKLNLDVILVSNFEDLPEIKTSVDHYIYDSENLLLAKEKSPVVWFSDSAEIIHIYSKGNSYMCCKHMKIGIDFCKEKYDNFVYFEFDNVISDSELCKVSDIFSALKTCDAWICNFDSHGTEYYDTKVFGGNVDFFSNQVNLPKSIDEWNSIPPFCNSSEGLERMFVLLLAEFKNRIYFTNQPPESYFNSSEINKFISFSNAHIAYNNEDAKFPIAFVISIGGTYRILINDDEVYCRKHSSGEWIKYPFKVSENNTNIKIKREDELLIDADLNIHSIENIKYNCVRYPLVEKKENVLDAMIVKNERAQDAKKIAIVTLYDKNYEEFAKYSVPNKLKYANIHKYDLYAFSNTLDSSRPPQWSKIKAVQSVLRDYDWVWWIDIDSMVMNFDVKLESIIDDNYEMIFTSNQFSYLSNGSSFYRNTENINKFLTDCYELKLDILKDINVHVFDHEQQPMRKLIQSDENYRSKTKFINERVCNSFCKTNNQDVLRYYPNWNAAENLYQDGDFIIQFCGRTIAERLDSMFEYLLPKKISVILFADDKVIIDTQTEAIKNTKYQIETFLPKKHHKFTSFSQLVNYGVNESNEEFMVFVNPKTEVCAEDIDEIIKKLHCGYCFVSLVGFGLFGCTKQLFRQIGMMDERFIGGEYEDNDFALRMKLNNLAVYARFNTGKYYKNQSMSTYDSIRGCTLTKFFDKWNLDSTKKTYTISENDLMSGKISNRHNIENNIKYSWYRFDKSDIDPAYQVFESAKTRKIELSKKNKIATLVSAKVKIILSEEKKLTVFCNSMGLENSMLSCHVFEAENPTVHAIIYVQELHANTWCAIDLDKNKKYEIRLFQDGNILYRTFLYNPIDTTLDLILKVNVYEK